MSLLERLLRYFSTNGEGSSGDGAKTISAGIALNVVEWKVVGAAFVLVAILKLYGTPDFGIFLFLWAGDTVLSFLILAAERASEMDITFMDAYKRTIEKIKAWRWLYYPLSFVAILLIMIFYGPAYVVSYYKDYFYQRRPLVRAVVPLMAGGQMLIWTPAYLAGIDLLVFLFGGGT